MSRTTPSAASRVVSFPRIALGLDSLPKQPVCVRTAPARRIHGEKPRRLLSVSYERRGPVRWLRWNWVPEPGDVFGTAAVREDLVTKNL